MLKKNDLADFLVLAMKLVERGLRVFPLEENGKKPAITSFPTRASDSAGQITKWYHNGPERNVGVSTTVSKFGPLVVIDVDNKNGVNGSESLQFLDMCGDTLPPTLVVETPTGGFHYYFVAPHPIKQGVSVLGPGLDIRAAGGYVVGPGSVIDGVEYKIIEDREIAPAPQWLIDRLPRVVQKEKKAATKKTKTVKETDKSRAYQRGIDYLKNHAPKGVQGNRDHLAYVIAAKLKDLNNNEDDILELMLKYWDCEPMPPVEDIQEKIDNAFKYGQNEPGSDAPEIVFDDEVSATPDEPKPEGDATSTGGGEGGASDNGIPFFEKVNENYAYVEEGDLIIKEWREGNRRKFLRQSITNFENALANRTFDVGKRTYSVPVEWMKWKDRRQFDRIAFRPGDKFLKPGEYNSWLGFSVEPAASASHPAVDMLIDHIKNNACGGDEKLTRWFIGFFAHMIQRPWEKPLVALVFHGGKGVGKTIICEIMRKLFPEHALITDNPRFLVGNFNSHFEECLLFVSDEAFWGGDKKHEGQIKGLITGSQHTIERKGKEAYSSDNKTRIVIVGNEQRLVHATGDERRFAVFNFGENRKQDTAYFKKILREMDNGGLEAWLRYLLDFDLTDVDVDVAPVTKALFDQKIAGLSDVILWWLECLSENKLVGDPFDGPLPDRITTKRLNKAFNDYSKENGGGNRFLPKGRNRYAEIRMAAPRLEGPKPDHSAEGKAQAKAAGDKSSRSFFNPGIDVLRADFCKFIGHEVNWESDNND